MFINVEMEPRNMSIPSVRNVTRTSVRNISIPVFIRRAHRVLAAMWLLFVAIGLSLEAVGGPESPLVTIPIVVFLILMVITGSYLLARPWVARIRAR